MGQHFTAITQPEGIAVFRQSSMTDVIIPEREENRHVTNKLFLYIFIGCVVSLIPFLIYSLIGADIYKMYNYDQCGNFCGRKNIKYDKWACTGKDFTDFNTPVLRICVKESSNMSITSNMLLAIYKFQDKVLLRIIACCIVAIVIIIVIWIPFLYATTAVVWGTIGTVIVLTGVCTGISLYAGINLGIRGMFTIGINYMPIVLGVGIVIGVVWIILAPYTFFAYKKIQLAIMLIVEATKAVLAMPLIILVPTIILFVDTLIAIILATLIVYMLSTGNLTELEEGYLSYELEYITIFTITYTSLILLWALFITGAIENMVIGWAVSKWYFGRNENLNSPILTGTKITLKYHFGSIAGGSFFMMLFTIVRFIVQYSMKDQNINVALEAATNTCCDIIQRILQFWTNNAYILTAMHGQPFIRCGKRAAQIIMHNVLNIITLSTAIGGIFFLLILFVIFVTMFISLGIFQGVEDESIWVAYLTVFVICFIIGCFFFSVYDTIVTTIFLCYCEDQLLNNGRDRPYAMSEHLSKYIESSKVIYKENRETEELL